MAGGDDQIGRIEIDDQCAGCNVSDHLVKEAPRVVVIWTVVEPQQLDRSHATASVVIVDRHGPGQVCPPSSER